MYWNSLATETVLKVVLRGNAVISLRVRFTLAILSKAWYNCE